MTLASALLLAALAADPATPAPPAEQPAPPPGQPQPPAKAPAPHARPGGRPLVAPMASLPSVEGVIEEVDHRAHRLRVRTAAGPQLLSFDRNTLVLGPAGALTPVQLAAGMRVKVGRDGEQRAAWVELTPPPSTPDRAP
jgi:hypothetical protein